MSIVGRVLKSWLLASGLLLAVPLQAATFTVAGTADRADTNPGDGICNSNLNYCTLRAAIQEANALPGADTIMVPAGTYTLTIYGSGEDAGYTGDLDISDDVTIIGGTSVSTDTLITAQSSGGIRDRVMHILGSTGRALNVELRNLSLIYGYWKTGISGGGNLCIACEYNILGNPSLNDPPAHNVTLRNVSIIGGQSVDGAGILNNEGILLIEDSTIRLNSTPYNPASTTANNEGGGFGGGIANFGGTVTLRRSVVRNNRAQAGGGISNEDRGNKRGRVIVELNSQLDNNLAFQGGGIYNSTGGWASTSRTLVDYGLRVDQSSIINNQAEVGGGGIFNFGLGAVLVTNSTISGNVAEAVFSGMNQMDGFSQVGGGIYHAGAIMDVIGSTLAGNSIGSGSGMMMNGVTLGGHELYVNSSNAPASGFPFWISFQSTILGDTGSAGNVCGGTTGFTAYVTDAGGNTVADNTCGVVTSAKARGKAVVRGAADGADPLVGLGPLANNGGLPGQSLPDGTYPLTRALLPGSAAIGTGENCSRVDQRGFARGVNRCDAGAVQVEVNTKGYADPPPNLPPVARDDSFVTPRDQRLSVLVMNLLANDVDPDGDVVFIDKNSLVGKTRQGGRVSLAGTSKHFFHYEPPPGFTGSDSFSYRIGDGRLTATATVHIQVTDANQPPRAGDLVALSVEPGGVLDIDPLASRAVSDPEGDDLRYEILSPPSQGTATVTETGFVYTANSDAANVDEFRYRVSDGELWSGEARVIISIQPAMTLQANDYALAVAPGKLVHGKLAEASGSGPFYTYWLDPRDIAQGELLWFDPVTGEFLYRAGEQASGREEIAYGVKNTLATSRGLNGQGEQARVLIDILDAATSNVAPVAEAMELGTLQAGTRVELQLLASDADGDTLNFSIVEQPNKGVVETINPATGLFRLSLERHVTVNRDWFTFKVDDGQAESQTVQVAFSISHPDNQAPQASDDTGSTPSDMSLVLDVVANDSDADGDTLQPEPESATSEQGGLIEVVDGRLRYTPPTQFAGSDTFRYRASDGMTRSEPATVTISVIAASPAPLEAARDIENIWTDDTTVVVSPASRAATRSDSASLGALGWPLLFALGGLALLRRRIS